MGREICVSVDQAIERTSNRGLEFARELALYLIGWLHLVGFDDKEAEDRKIIAGRNGRSLDFVQDLELWLIFCSLEKVKENSESSCVRKTQQSFEKI